jgi:hypothetical protein
MKAEVATLLKKEQELQKLINLSALTLRPLHADFNYAVSEWRASNKSQFWARTSIRCMCAVIEAALFTLRKMAEQLAVVNDVQFERKEAELLAEKRIVKGNGVEKVRPLFLPFRESVIQSFRLFGKALGVRIVIDFGNGFDALCATFEVRNRLMHPKNPFSVEVRESDIQTADIAIAWFNITHLDVVAQSQSQIGTRVNELRKKSLR